MDWGFRCGLSLWWANRALFVPRRFRIGSSPVRVQQSWHRLTARNNNVLENTRQVGYQAGAFDSRRLHQTDNIERLCTAMAVVYPAPTKDTISASPQAELRFSPPFSPSATRGLGPDIPGLFPPQSPRFSLRLSEIMRSRRRRPLV